MFKVAYRSFCSIAFVLALASCSKDAETPSPNQAASNDHAPAPSTLNVPAGQSTIVKTDRGAQVRVTNLAPQVLVAGNATAQLVFDVEAAFSPESLSKLNALYSNRTIEERRQIILAETKAVFEKMKNLGALNLEAYPEVGYFTFQLAYTSDLTAPLKNIFFGHTLYFNPIHFDTNAINAVRAWTAADLELTAQANAPRNEHKGYSGLERIKAPEFVAAAESAIGNGVKVDGSSVKLGITDTGITYNHPTFLNTSGSNRIIYMKDYTGEGRVYFSDAAKFSAAPGKDDSTVVINAQIIESKKLPSKPAGDQFTEIKDLELKVSPALKALVLDPTQNVKLGILNEDVFQASGEEVDINANSKLDDKFYILFVPGKAQADGTMSDDVMYFDSEGKADFTQSQAMGDWNKSQKMVSVFAEKFGFNIRKDKLASADGKASIDLKSASIVGFDPGNHGSHVAGIAAGRKTLANDPDDTLARGVAPNAQILLNRVCANNTGCNATTALIDLVINGKAEVVNMSLGGLSPYNDGYGVEETIINRLTINNNVLFVISAGNSGPGRQTLGSPSTAKLSLSVGASASRGLIQRQYEWPGFGSGNSADPNEDFMLFFSSRGPTSAGGFKPNVSAPGTELSSVQLNSAPGAHGGLDVYWGTSMAAPTATGAYALFLDAIKKFNLAHPERALPSDVMTLRSVLIESARPFDVSRFEPATGNQSLGQYTFIDEGMGMIDLSAAWSKLLTVRDNNPASAVNLNGNGVELEYTPIVSMKMPNGLSYDGTGAYEDDQGKKLPKFGTGMTLNFYGTERLRPVYISRRLPESAASGPDAGDLTRQLLTTGDDFVLKTVIYGSNVEWIKAGTLDGANCWESDTSNLSVLSRGVDILVNDDGTATLTPYNASQLNVCINRNLITTRLPAGDHGALIFGYRTAQGKTSSIPSFIVPVSLTVPHRTLANSTAYEINGTVNSFGVDRNYVTIPAESNMVKITLEVEKAKLAPGGHLADGETCSGVELMMLEGGNTLKGSETRPMLRVGNCDTKGVPITGDAGRVLTLIRSKPKGGTWDVHVFGRYQFSQSKYKLRVDYLVAGSDTSEISGDVSALTGSINWNIKESSIPVELHAGNSTVELNSLFNKVNSQVENGKYVLVSNPLGSVRTYPAGTTQVTVTTGGSAGNDIDLTILECNPGAIDDKDSSCARVASSGGSTDVELAVFKPSATKVYMIRVDGYDIKAGNGAFESTESIEFRPELGAVTLSGSAPKFVVGYSFTADQIAKSKFLNHSLFVLGDYQVHGSLNLRTSGATLVDAIKMNIKH